MVVIIGNAGFGLGVPTEIMWHIITISTKNIVSKKTHAIGGTKKT